MPQGVWPVIIDIPCGPASSTSPCLQNKELVDKVEGADAAEISRRVERWATATVLPAPTAVIKPLSDLTKWLEQLTHASPVMLFMKGSPEDPKCKFSRRAVDLLKEAGVSFGSFSKLSLVMGR